MTSTTMDFMIRLVRSDDRGSGGFHFSLSSHSWALLLEVGQAFGWKPHGTTYLQSTPNPHSARHNYDPGEPRDYKCVDAQDALEWASALSRARNSSHLASMLDAHTHASSLPANTDSALARSEAAPFTVIIDEFVEYAFGGAFSFARADESQLTTGHKPQ